MTVVIVRQPGVTFAAFHLPLWDREAAETQRQGLERILPYILQAQNILSRPSYPWGPTDFMNTLGSISLLKQGCWSSFNLIPL